MLIPYLFNALLIAASIKKLKLTSVCFSSLLHALFSYSHLVLTHAFVFSSSSSSSLLHVGWCQQSMAASVSQHTNGNVRQSTQHNIKQCTHKTSSGHFNRHLTRTQYGYTLAHTNRIPHTGWVHILVVWLSQLRVARIRNEWSNGGSSMPVPASRNTTIA